MIKIAIGLLIGLLIGATCRWFDIPVPAPSKLIGALLVLSITVGYLTVDQMLGPGEVRNQKSEVRSQNPES